MPWRLLKHGLTSSHNEPRFFPESRPLKPHYDVVIIGGGGHGVVLRRAMTEHYLLEKSRVSAQSQVTLTLTLTIKHVEW